MQLKSIANISKRVFHVITGSFEYYGAVIPAKKCDHDPIKYLGKEVWAFCDEDCIRNASPRQQIEKTSLTKSQIVQFLSLWFMQVDEKGVIKELNIQELADFLNYDKRTVEHNLTVLQKVGLISVASRGTRSRSILIHDRQSYMDNGYLQMTPQHLTELAKLTKINALRVSIRSYLEFDNHEIERQIKKDDTTHIRRERILSAVPSYARTPKKMTELVKEQKHIVQIDWTAKHTQSDRIHVYVRHELYGKKQRDVQLRNFESEIIKLRHKTAVPLHDPKDIIAIAKLCIQYSFETVEYEIRRWGRLIEVGRDPQVINPPAYIRKGILITQYGGLPAYR